MMLSRNLQKLIKISKCGSILKLSVHRKCINAKCLNFVKKISSDCGNLDLPEDHPILPQRHLEDPIVQKLTQCISVQDVIDILENDLKEFNATHVVQTVYVLWNLQSVYGNVNARLYQDSINNQLYDPHMLLEQYIKEINSHRMFDELLGKVDEKYGELDLDTLSSVILYLTKMGVAIENPVIQKMIRNFENLVSSSEFVEMPAISKFLVAIFKQKGLYPIFATSYLLPFVLEALEKCECPEEFRLITISLNCLHQIISEDILDNYRKKAELLLSKNIITSRNPKTITKIVQFLNYPHWSAKNVTTIRKFMLCLNDADLSQLESKEIVLINKVLMSQLEPRELLIKIHQIALHNFFHDNNDPSVYNSPDLLSCMVGYCTPEKRRTYETIVQNYVNSTVTANTIPAIFNVLRKIKTSDHQLCSKFWQNTLQFLENYPGERLDFKLFRICHYYMHFNNNLAGTFRYYNFEVAMCNWLITNIEETMTKFIPSKYARAIQFLIAYGFTTKRNRSILIFLQNNKKHLIEIAQQFNHIDLLNVSRGLRISQHLQSRNYKIQNDLYVEYQSILNTLLHERSVDLIERGNLSVVESNNLLKCYVNRNAIAFKDNLFEKLIYKHVQLIIQNRDSLTFRLIKDTTFIFQNTNCLVPELMEYLIDYVIDNSSYMFADMCGRVLNLSFFLGYTPSHHKSERFFEICNQILESDKNQLSGLSLVMIALSLAYYQKLPETLLFYIFSQEFLSQIDFEIQKCFSKGSYPFRVRTTLMQLNRAICLDSPDANLPWFHQKFIDDLIKIDESKTKKSPLSILVYQNLLDVVGNRDYIDTNVHTSYGYKINFLVYLNEAKNLVPVKSNDKTDSYTKIAFIVLTPQSTTILQRNLKGEYQLKHRHLEILGFRVVYINPILWSSEYLKDVNDRREFLRAHIWPEKYNH